MNARFVTALLLQSFLVGNAAAQAPSFERILLPITLNGPTPGAYGSLWTTQVRARAIGSIVRFRQFAACQACLPTFEVLPDTTVDLPVAVFRTPAWPAGTLVYLLRDPQSNVELNLRVADISRLSSTLGTELPVVRERDFHTLPLTLISVPTTGTFRDALRIYDVDSGDDSTFRIEIFDEKTRERIVEDVRTVQPSPFPGEASYVPSVVEIFSLTDTYPQLATATTVAITVAPMRSGMRFWAFVAVTNNETQNVTTITPMTPY
jgi:hypothetical protein